MAWAEIEKEFNLLSLVMQERTVQQLKKLWTNLKQTQRDALTKERRSRFVTGGGPAIPLAMIDPDVAIIAPNLMKNAPILFSFNMPEEVVHDRRQQILNNENIDIIVQDSQFEIDDELITDELLDATIPSEATVINTDSEGMSHAGSSNISTIHSKDKKGYKGQSLQPDIQPAGTSVCTYKTYYEAGRGFGYIAQAKPEGIA
ncbi:uncharacterized protein LOC107274073 isoform X2 [Cephus cinctus]|uniref:Regulatory protein zeste n=1 Tax=Cephus cinctus TaxID=211228 RepID=A0AAJ7RU16_CEPCN|nr:uncharacterized protein LOC107274073 isoform X2 [Cephus cinctus]